MNNQNVSIVRCYSLSIKETGKVFYVGFTSKTLSRRLACHIAESRSSSPYNIEKAEIIRKANFDISINLLEEKETTVFNEGKEIEAKWIHHFISNGFVLTNCKQEKKVFTIPDKYRQMIITWAFSSLERRRYFKAYLKLSNTDFYKLLDNKGISLSTTEYVIKKLKYLKNPKCRLMSIRNYFEKMERKNNNKISELA